MLLILEPEQGSLLAEAIAEAAEERGVELLRWSPAQMIGEVSLALSIDESGARVTFGLADGRELRGEELRGVITLIDGFDPELWPRYSPRDRDYAATEALASWVAALTALPCPLLNRPAPDALGGAVLSPVVVSTIAARVGLGAPSTAYLESAAALQDPRADELRATATALGHLPLCEVPLTGEWLRGAGAGPIRVRGVGEDRRRVVVVGEDVLPVPAASLPEEVERALLELHRRLGRRFGEVWLGRDERGRWLVEDALRWPSATATRALSAELGEAIVTTCTENSRW